MLPGMMNPMVGAGSAGWYSSINQQGLGSGLKLCLDAADVASYSGSGQTWSDQSGLAFDWYRGTGSGADAADPTFVGTAGSQAVGTYFGVNGSQWFSPVSAIPAWLKNIQKANAKFTFAGWIYVPTLTTGSIFGNGTGVIPLYGFQVFMNSGGHLEFDCTNSGGGPSSAIDIVTTATFNTSTWNFFMVSVDAAATTGFLQINGTQEAKTTTYSSPSTNDPTYATAIMAGGQNNFPMPNNSRVAALAGWDQLSFTTAQGLALFNATRSRFGV
jgi:hypothetical protein